jgi:hypothetical protein
MAVRGSVDFSARMKVKGAKTGKRSHDLELFVFAVVEAVPIGNCVGAAVCRKAVVDILQGQRLIEDQRI